MTQGYTATLVAAALAISRSSLYYRRQPRGSRADRRYDEQIVAAFGEKPAYGYRRVAWWLRRKESLVVNRKRVLRVMRERGLPVRSSSAAGAAAQGVGPRGSSAAQSGLAVGLVGCCKPREVEPRMVFPAASPTVGPPCPWHPEPPHFLTPLHMSPPLNRVAAPLRQSLRPAGIAAPAPLRPAGPRRSAGL